MQNKKIDEQRHQELLNQNMIHLNQTIFKLSVAILINLE